MYMVKKNRGEGHFSLRRKSLEGEVVLLSWQVTLSEKFEQQALELVYCSKEQVIEELERILRESGVSLKAIRATPNG